MHCSAQNVTMCFGDRFRVGRVELFTAKNVVLNKVFLIESRHFSVPNVPNMERTIAKISKNQQRLMALLLILADYACVVYMLRMDVN
jgi:hypothetical protein